MRQGMRPGNRMTLFRFDDDEPADELLLEAQAILNEHPPREAAESWERNIDLVTLLAAVHAAWQPPETNTGELAEELRPFLRAAFEMGRTSEEYHGK